MTAEIISVGTELLLGQVLNTDARDIARSLCELGVSVFHQTVVGDNPARLRAVLELAKTRADIIITTGGLGPTYDDLTRETVCETFGVKLVRHEPTWAKIQAYFRDIGRPLTQNNERQALLPENATIFENDWGTAPGCGFVADGTHVLMLPGPPRECVAMLTHCAVPYLQALSKEALVSRSVRIFGVGESYVEDRIKSLVEHETNPTVAPYAHGGEVYLRVTAKAPDAETARAMTEPMVQKLQDILGDVVYGVDVDSLESCVVRLLTQCQKKLAVAESCTGGLITKRITDCTGASRVLLGGVCAYANEIKTSVLRVPAALIERFGVVSEEVACALSEGALELFNADFALGSTGVAGPEHEGVPGGTVFLALSERGKPTRCLGLHLGQDRERVRNAASGYALDLLRRRLCGLPEVIR